MIILSYSSRIKGPQTTTSASGLSSVSKREKTSRRRPLSRHSRRRTAAPRRRKPVRTTRRMARDRRRRNGNAITARNQAISRGNVERKRGMKPKEKGGRRPAHWRSQEAERGSHPHDTKRLDTSTTTRTHAEQRSSTMDQALRSLRLQRIGLPNPRGIGI